VVMGAGEAVSHQSVSSKGEKRFVISITSGETSVRPLEWSRALALFIPRTRDGAIPAPVTQK
jgi:hypothetical protein